MTPDERERLMNLCTRIADETSYKRFTELTLELSYMLERHGDELKSNDQSKLRSGSRTQRSVQTAQDGRTRRQGNDS